MKHAFIRSVILIFCVVGAFFSPVVQLIPMAAMFLVAVLIDLFFEIVAHWRRERTLADIFTCIAGCRRRLEVYKSPAEQAEIQEELASLTEYMQKL